MLKLATVLCVTLFAASALAQYKTNTYGGYTSPYASTSNTSSYGESKHVISGALGFMNPGMNTVVGTNNGTTVSRNFTLSGLFGIGGDYDYMYSKDISFGGFLRYYSTTTTVGNTDVKNSLFTLGGDVRGYLQNETWALFVGAGLGYLVPGYTEGGQTLSIDSSFGLMGEMGMMYKYSPTLWFGVENMRLIGLTSHINGEISNDFMLKVRFAL